MKQDLNTLKYVIAPLLFLFCISTSGFAAPQSSMLDITLSHSQSGLISGQKSVTIKIFSEGNEGSPVWSTVNPTITFTNGTAAIPLGPFNDGTLDISNPQLSLTFDGESVAFPITASLYAIQARTADTAEQLLDTDALYISNLSRVGIGTTSPTEKLTVDGSIKLSDPVGKIEFFDGSKIGSLSDISAAGSLWNSGVGSINYSTGNVGIGTDSPAQQLEVSGNIRFSTLSTSSESSVLVVNANGDISKRNYPTGSDSIALTGTSFAIAENGASVGEVLKWTGDEWVPSSDSGLGLIAGSGIVIDGTTIKVTSLNADEGEILKWNGSNWETSADAGTVYTGSNGITISGGTDIQMASGLTYDGSNLGIGITPSQLLDINGPMRLRSTGDPTLGAGDAGVVVFNSGIFKGWDGSQWLSLSDSVVVTDNSALWTGNANDIFALPTSNLGIGTSTPQTKLHVSGDMRVDVLGDGSAFESVVVVNGDGKFFSRTLSDSIWNGDANYTAGNGVTINGQEIAITSENVNDGDVLRFDSGEWVTGQLDVGEAITLNGTAIALSTENVSTNEIYKFDGNNWVATVDRGALIVDGDGILVTYDAGDPEVGLAAGTSTSNALIWSGSSWVSTAPIKVGDDLSFSAGTLNIAQNGASNGNVLSWQTDQWIPTAAGSLLNGGNGINVSGNQILLESGLSYDDINERLGINEESPRQKLDINGLLRLQNQGAAPALDANDAGSLMFKDGVFQGWTGTEWQTLSSSNAVAGGVGILLANGDNYYIEPTENFGIGTANPTAKLHVSGDVKIASASVSATLESVVVIGSDGLLQQRTIPTDIWDGDDDTTYLAGNGIILNGTTLSIDQMGAAQGDIIRWNDTAGQWEASDNVSSTTAGNGITVTDGTVSLEDQVDTTWNVNTLMLRESNLGNTADVKLIVGKNDDVDHQMRVFSEGQITVGYSSPGDFALAIDGFTRLSSTIVDFTSYFGGKGGTAGLGGSQSGPTVRIDSVTSNASSTVLDVRNFSGTSIFDILQDGTVTVTGTFVDNSDSRWKKNVQLIPNAVEKIQQLRGITYDWNDDYPYLNNEKKQVGVIAQEVEAVLPEVVHTNEEGYKSVEYRKMTALLIEAIKEQQTQIDALKTEIDLLKSQ